MVYISKKTKRNKLILNRGFRIEPQLKLTARAVAALHEGERLANDPNARGFYSVEELFAYLNSDDEDDE